MNISMLTIVLGKEQNNIYSRLGAIGSYVAGLSLFTRSVHGFTARDNGEGERTSPYIGPDLVWHA